MLKVSSVFSIVYILCVIWCLFFPVLLCFYEIQQPGFFGWSKNKMVFIVWLFVIFRFSFSFFQCFSSVPCFIKQFFGDLHLFWDFFYGEHSAILAKNQVQIIVFNKKAVVNISRISTQRVHDETLLNFVASFSWKMSQENSVLNYFSFDCELM